MFKVKAVILDGVAIKGYRLFDLDKNEDIKVQVSKMNELIKSGNVQGVEIVEDEGIEYIVGLKLRDLMLESPSSVRLKDKVKDANGNVAGYVITSENGNEKSISAKKAWNLAASGSISNGEASFLKKRDGSVSKYFQCHFS